MWQNIKLPLALFPRAGQLLCASSTVVPLPNNSYFVPGEQKLLLEIRAAADHLWVQHLQPVIKKARGGP